LPSAALRVSEVLREFPGPLHLVTRV
jgi:hypothetical protein